MPQSLINDLIALAASSWADFISFLKITGQRIAAWFHAAKDFISLPTYRTRRLYTAKTIGVMITLSFACGSLYYAKRAAD
jgi:hypothetical protein